MKSINLKQVTQMLMQKNQIRPPKITKIPQHLKRYPNMHFRKNTIIDCDLKVKGEPDFSKVLDKPIKLRFQKTRKYLKLKHEMPPQHAFINFKNMSGNEILYNMLNAKYFRNSELVNCIYEFSKRVLLPENHSVKVNSFRTHPYFQELYNLVLTSIPRFNLKHIIVTTMAFDNLKGLIKSQEWAEIEKSVDRLLHKLKPSQIIIFLDLLNREDNRSTKDILHKLLTILPIHIDKLNDKELLLLIDTCIKKDLKNERLFSYFIYPRIEKRVAKFSLYNYLKVLDLLANLQYQEDLEFWEKSILPCIFNYTYSQTNAQKLWEAFIKVKVNCSNLNIAKHLLLIENILKQFKNLQESGEKIDDLLLKLEEDFTLMAVKEESPFKNIKEIESRLKDQAVLKSFMEKINTQDNSESKIQEAESNIKKILEIKDWKKAKYEYHKAEIEKVRLASQAPVTETKIDTISNEKEPTELSAENNKSDKDISMEEANNKSEDKFNELNEKHLKMKAKSKNSKEQSNSSSEEKTNSGNENK